MMESARQIWSRNAVGYRLGELDDGDGLAAMVVTMIGGPALLVGASLAIRDGLNLPQILLLAPVAAILGGAVIGGSARMAASTGASGAWLLRPAFGIAGSWVISVLRLTMVVIWAAMGLRLAGRWGDSVLSSVGVSLGGTGVVILLMAVLGLLMTYPGPFATIRHLIRRPLFWGSVMLLAVGALRLVSVGGTPGGGSGGAFWLGAQRAVEMSAIFVPFVQTIARRLADDRDSGTTFGVGYTIPATLMLVAGAVFAQRLGGISDLTALDAGSIGVGLAAAWVLVAEVDQAFASFIAAGSEATGIVGRVSPLVLGGVTAAGITLAAVVLPGLTVDWASLATAVVFPACLIAAADYFLARDRHYSESEIYGAAAGGSLINVVGVVMWVLAVIVGQVLDPVGPTRWVALMPELAVVPGIPWRLLMALVAAIGYVVLLRWRDHRAADVYELRGV